MTGLYRRLAVMGIRSNRQLFGPYLVTCSGMALVYYILAALASSPTFLSLPGAATMRSMLQLGAWVIGFFSLIFLSYTHSFLIRRRKKEFGLYNILGMDKKNLACVLAWETAITAGLSLGLGLALGVAFLKLSELALLKLLQAQAGFSLWVSADAVLSTLVLFGCIFLFILVRDLWTIRSTNPVQLLRSENLGEKPPRANYLLALAGGALLVWAYDLAVTIESPVTAIFLFFVAALMVIAATYLLFVAGSVALCRLLQKNKRFYYQTRHFISVSSMAYRMKRSGEGLASICILCTMVLVTLSSTVCLYVGAEDALRRTYPMDLNATIALTGADRLSDGTAETLRAAFDGALSGQQLHPTRTVSFRQAVLPALRQGDVILPLSETDDGLDSCYVYLLSLEDYNRCAETPAELDNDEALVYTNREPVYAEPTLTIQGCAPLKVLQVLDSRPLNCGDNSLIVPSLVVVVRDLEDYIQPLQGLTGYNDRPLLQLQWYCGADVSDAAGAQIDASLALKQIYSDLLHAEGTGVNGVSVTSLANERDGYYSIYGGLLFLGIVLGTVFLCTALIIMYYKQLSEGYEDQNRFAILQKVGITKQEIWQSVNSQILLVFFLPPLAAALHMAFAFPMIRRMLLLFNLYNTKLLVLCTLIVLAVFLLLYTLAYRITSRTYYKIVSSADQSR